MSNNYYIYNKQHFIINDNIEPSKEDLFVVAVKVGLNKKEIVEVFEGCGRLFENIDNVKFIQMQITAFATD
ncbi:hypothetical protein DWW52_09455 [Odoribacter sp. AF15-53]|nr:hypothetical protein DWW52_09455 [Odoribacter sp. AF15-53]